MKKLPVIRGDDSLNQTFTSKFKNTEKQKTE